MAAFIAILISIILLTVILVSYKQFKEKNQFDFVTGVGIVAKIFTWFFFGLGLLMLFISTILSLNKNPDNEVAIWVLFGVGLFFDILGLILVNSICYDKEYISGYDIIVRRFFFKKIRKISDIRLIQKVSHQMLFFDVNNKRLFMVDCYTKGLDEFIHILITKSKELNCNIIIEVDGIAQSSNVTLDPTNEEHREEIEKYIKIGADYRAGYMDRLKDNKLVLIGTIIAGVVIGLGFLILEGGIFGIVLAGIVIFVATNNHKKIKVRLTAEMSKSDFELGQSYAHKSDIVIGGTKRKYSMYLGGGFAVLIFGILFMLGSVFSLNPYKPDYDELVRLEGTLEYGYEWYDDESYIAFGFEDKVPSKGNEYEITEYRLPEYCMSQFNNEFFNIEMFYENGKEITHKLVLYVDRSTLEEQDSEEDDRKTQYYNVYYVAVDGVEYFNFDMCETAYSTHNTKISIATGLFAAISIASIVWIVIFTKKTSDAKKKEYMSI